VRIQSTRSQDLVIPLAMIVRGELSQGSAEMPFAEGSDAIEAFFLDRPDEPLCVRITVRRPGRRTHDLHTSRAQLLFNGAAPPRIPIAQQQSPLRQQA